MSDKIIKITKHGPYLVSGNVPMTTKNIIEEDHINVWSGGDEFPATETYALCRCGKSKNPPFCDGAHASAGFDGKETASMESYIKRAHSIEGERVDLLDDDRCAFAGFCYVDGRNVWELAEHSGTEDEKKAAIEGACACPAGRLTAVDKDGNVIEPELEQEIVVIRNKAGNNCGYYVKGGIDLESSDGELYEKRNRYILCCCGGSENKPFCDGNHISQDTDTDIE